MARFDWIPGQIAPITADGRTLEATCFGPPPGTAPTIVMLHEGLGCLALWRDFPERIAEATGFGVFVYSRAGYGRSGPADLPRPTDYMTDEAVDVLPDVLDAFGFQRGILLGHSDGATIAAIYAGSVPDLRVRGLILMAPHFFAEEMGLAEIAQAREAFATTDLRTRMAKYHDAPTRTFAGWADVWLSDAFRRWNVADTIDHWRIPCLAIQGRQDQYGTLAQIREIEERIYAPLETVVLDDCGHAPHTEAPNATLEAITGFVARLERLEAEIVPVS